MPLRARRNNGDGDRDQSARRSPPIPTSRATATSTGIFWRSCNGPAKGWWALFALATAGVGLLFFAWGIQLVKGIGVAGITKPVGWGVYITTFVFWVGIAHSGTLVSAILFLFRAPWRQSIYRAAEAMTVFAVMTAGLFPLIHVGRAWLAYWLFPYPNSRFLWPNFRSPLVWDVFAVTTYFTVSATFFYLGAIPDIAAAREAATGLRKQFYQFISLGWRGTDREWHHFGKAYIFLAALATPLVLSVHSVVSWDFAMGITPGWHATIFAPYFVAGAIFSGMAMVITLTIPVTQGLRPSGLSHDQALRRDGQADPADLDDRVVRLPHRILHGLVFR